MSRGCQGGVEAVCQLSRPHHVFFTRSSVAARVYEVVLSTPLSLGLGPTAPGSSFAEGFAESVCGVAGSIGLASAFSPAAEQGHSQHALHRGQSRA